VGVSEGTLYLWRCQALIDAGRAEGVKSFEADELAIRHMASTKRAVVSKTLRKCSFYLAISVTGCY
jgi:hypothetical protein